MKIWCSSDKTMTIIFNNVKIKKVNPFIYLSFHFTLYSIKQPTNRAAISMRMSHRQHAYVFREKNLSSYIHLFIQLIGSAEKQAWNVFFAVPK